MRNKSACLIPTFSKSARRVWPTVTNSAVESIPQKDKLSVLTELAKRGIDLCIGGSDRMWVVVRFRFRVIFYHAFPHSSTTMLPHRFLSSEVSIRFANFRKADWCVQILGSPRSPPLALRSPPMIMTMRPQPNRIADRSNRG